MAKNREHLKEMTKSNQNQKKHQKSMEYGKNNERLENICKQ